MSLDDMNDSIEYQIESEKKEFEFDIREYPLEFLQLQFNPPINSGKEADLYIPDYQREFVWAKKQQSLFIESLLIGLPVPYIFGADVTDYEDAGDGRVEIVDGAQRIQTIDAFITNNLVLQDMEKIPLLNGKQFKDLIPSRQRRFLRTTIRMIELQNINEDGRRMMFDRLNSGGSKLSDMEKRRGTANSKFLHFVDDLVQQDLIKELTPLPEVKLNRREREEYILRFFAYFKNYQSFGNSVQNFLKDFISEIDIDFDNQKSDFEDIINKTFIFVNNNFPCGFRRSKTISIVSRVRFEAIAVGIALAINENPALATMKNINVDWAFEDEFLSMIRSDASNSRPKVITRIEYVKNKLLGN